MKQSIYDAVREGDLEAVRDALAFGLNPSIQDKDGYSLLHHAAFNVRLDIVRELLAAGADRHIKNNDGYTPVECMDISVVYENEDYDEEENFYLIEALLKKE